MECRICGEDIPEDAYFCPKCAASTTLVSTKSVNSDMLYIMCPSCGAIIDKGDKYCEQCGVLIKGIKFKIKLKISQFILPQVHEMLSKPSELLSRLCEACKETMLFKNVTRDSLRAIIAIFALLMIAAVIVVFSMPNN